MFFCFVFVFAAVPSHSDIAGRCTTIQLQVLCSLVGLDLPFSVVGDKLEEQSVDSVPCLDLHCHGDEEGDKEHDATG